MPQKGQRPARGAEDLILPQPDHSQHHTRQQRRRHEDEMHDGDGKGYQRGGEAESQRDQRPLGAVPAVQNRDLDRRLTGRGAEALERQRSARSSIRAPALYSNGYFRR